MATCIDAMLTRDLGDKISNWKVDQNYNGSDHNTIIFEILASEKKMTKTRNWEKGDWGSFTSRIRSEEFYEPEVMTEKKLDRCVQQMYKKLITVLNDTCPKKARKKKIKANTWFTKDHKKLAKKVKKAYKRGKRNLGESWVYYKKICLLYTSPSPRD